MKLALQKRLLNIFIDSHKEIKFGDYLVFQEYTPLQGNSNQTKVSPPKLVIYLGMFVADMAVGFNYIQWVNTNRLDNYSTETRPNYFVIREANNVENHIEWSDHVDILGHFNHRPTWKEMLPAFRIQNTEKVVATDSLVFGL